jgi:hypothetical protein
VKRLLQFGVLLLSLVAVLTPLVEFFDRWDPPVAPINDTELGVFGIVLLFALVLLVSRLLAMLDRMIRIGALFHLGIPSSMASAPSLKFGFVVVPNSSPPLRI